MKKEDLNRNKETNCPRCKKAFVCKPENISECDCTKVPLSTEEYRFISSQYTVCVCNACLKALKEEYNSKFHYNKPKNFINRNFILFFIFLFALSLRLSAQTYAPPAGQAGTTAMHKDSSAFVNWVQSCKITRGYQDLSNTALGYASVGDSSMVNGKAQTNGVVSLGDGGSVICSFPFPITNGPGYDFAVFENSLDDTFLELAFVEVSSDGVNYVRFPAHSLSDTMNQTGGFGPTNATKINNLAGKYRAGFGTPFDLQELSGSVGLDINHITRVKITDVVGSLNDLYATRDKDQNKINDPWPTPYPSGGFDLDAIGVIHETQAVGVEESLLFAQGVIYPNPCRAGDELYFKIGETVQRIEFSDASGASVFYSESDQFNTAFLKRGMYFVKIRSSHSVTVHKLLVL